MCLTLQHLSSNFISFLMPNTMLTSSLIWVDSQNISLISTIYIRTATKFKYNIMFRPIEFKFNERRSSNYKTLFLKKLILIIYLNELAILYLWWQKTQVFCKLYQISRKFMQDQQIYNDINYCYMQLHLLCFILIRLYMEASEPKWVNPKKYLNQGVPGISVLRACWVLLMWN